MYKSPLLPSLQPDAGRGAPRLFAVAPAARKHMLFLPPLAMVRHVCPQALMFNFNLLGDTTPLISNL